MTSKELDLFINDKVGISFDGKTPKEIDFIRFLTLCALGFAVANAVFCLLEGASDDGK